MLGVTATHGKKKDDRRPDLLWAHRLTSETRFKSAAVPPHELYGKEVRVDRDKTFVLTSSAVNPCEITELNGIPAISAYTLQLVAQATRPPLLMVGEQNPDKSGKRHHVWDFFGGKVDLAADESPTAAAVRERLEEAGITEDQAPYIDPVIYVIFEEEGRKVAKAFYFSVMSDSMLSNAQGFINFCQSEISKKAAGRFELISLGLVGIEELFAQLIDDAAHPEAKIGSQLRLIENKAIRRLKDRHSWRGHVKLFLGNPTLQELILQIVEEITPEPRLSAGTRTEKGSTKPAIF